MACRSTFTVITAVALLSLAACGDDTATSGTASESSTGASGGMSFSATSAEPTGDPEPEVTRVVYRRFGERSTTIALRGVEIVDGAPQPPFDILVAPPDSGLQIYSSLELPRWLPVTTHGADPSRFWIVDTTTLSAHESAVPPGSAFDWPRLDDRGSGVILPAAEGAEQAPFMVCAIDEGGSCPLLELDPLLPAGVVLDDVRELSASRGWVVYTTRPGLGDGVDVHLAGLDSLDAPLTLASFPTATSLRTARSLDDGTLYIEVGAGTQSLEHVAIDLTSDPPGPPVALHPPLLGGEHEALWAPDMSALLLFSGANGFGDLHLVEVDGAAAGPMQPIHASAPGHAFHSPSEIACFAADGARFTYYSDHESPGVAQIYLVDRAAPGGPPKRLNGPLEPGEFVFESKFLHDSERLVYFTNERIVSATIDGPSVTHTLNPPEVDSLISSVHQSADGSQIVFSNIPVVNHTELFHVHLATPEPAAIALADFLPAGRPLWQGFSPSGRQFFVSLGVDSFTGPMSVAMIPLDPLAEAVVLSEPGERGYFLHIVPPT
ncbi:hypothetical protein OV203_50505 [Nannocystis sp. ILAH1]|uniref:hypothetical protein n=1 Tax=Nannocystis sp. ILAH1 TaxID=2996789 RepID=UPI00226F0B90|nr:hypothetical protein [Nannocystis sp. ILAH1]MCY0987936.1 hypothetical protein [Nannocystis sp. ILAH1]MCY0995459.1 hypothetical protein [Nannocystis sp. ILAH1]